MATGLTTAKAMIAAYNAQDVDTYVSVHDPRRLRGELSRRMWCARARKARASGLAAAFARWPQNHAEIVEAQAIGDYVLMREHVTRGPATDGFGAGRAVRR